MESEKEKDTLYENPVWEKTFDKIGILPKEPLVCPICFARNLFKAIQEGKDLKEVKAPRLFIRRSRLHPVPDIRMTRRDDGHRPYAFDTVCKCPQCDFYCVFGVPTDLKYALDTIKARGDSHDFYIPDEMWEESGEVDDEVRKKLRAYGYA